MKGARLLVLGGYRLMRESLAARLTEVGFEVVPADAAAGSAEPGARESSVDLVLVHVGRRADEDLDLVREARARHPQAPILVHGLEPEGDDVLRYVDLGVNGYLAADCSWSDLVAALEVVVSGEIACGPPLVAAMFSGLRELSQGAKRRKELGALDLTPREMEVLRLVADGLSNKQIAKQLHLSLHTVKNHVHNFLEKLQVGDRSAAARFAQDQHWLEVRERRRS